MSAILGGDEKPRFELKSSVTTGTIYDVYQHEGTRKWYVSVELSSGDIINNVIPVRSFSGLMSGSVEPIRKGSTGILLFPENDETRQAYWIGAIDVHPEGIDIDTPTESVYIHPSGTSTAITEDGTFTKQFANGDLFWFGGGAPYRFDLRTPEGIKPLPTIKKSNVYMLDLSSGGVLLKVKLFGNLGFEMNSKESKIFLKVSDKSKIEILDGIINVTTGVMMVGPNPSLTTPVALAEATNINDNILLDEIKHLKEKVVHLSAQLHKLKVQFYSHYHNRNFPVPDPLSMANNLIYIAKYQPMNLMNQVANTIMATPCYTAATPESEYDLTQPLPTSHLIITKNDPTGGFNKDANTTEMLDASSETIRGS